LLLRENRVFTLLMNTSHLPALRTLHKFTAAIWADKFHFFRTFMAKCMLYDSVPMRITAAKKSTPFNIQAPPTPLYSSTMQSGYLFLYKLNHTYHLRSKFLCKNFLPYRKTDRNNHSSCPLHLYFPKKRLIPSTAYS
jgi:hypothetical protein